MTRSVESSYVRISCGMMRIFLDIRVDNALAPKKPKTKHARLFPNADAGKENWRADP